MHRANAESLLSTLVKRNREAHGWSQAALAERLRTHGMDIHGTGIARLENGDRAIRLDEALTLMRVLGLDAAELLPALESFDSRVREPASLQDRLRAAKEISDAAHEMVSTVLADVLADQAQAQADLEADSAADPSGGNPKWWIK